MCLFGFRNTARTTREFPTEETIVINIEDEAVKKDKCIEAVVFTHGSLPSRDIFCPFISKRGKWKCFL